VQLIEDEFTKVTVSKGHGVRASRMPLGTEIRYTRPVSGHGVRASRMPLGTEIRYTRPVSEQATCHFEGNRQITDMCP
jgi:hypothetical protein